MRPSARIRRATAPSGSGIDAWPALPVATILSQRGAFSVTSTSHATVRPSSTEIVLPSVRQYSASRRSDRYRSTIAATPLSLPSSSSAVPRNRTSRSSGTPPRFKSSIVTSWQMAVPFMSVAPRPQM